MTAIDGKQDGYNRSRGRSPLRTLRELRLDRGLRLADLEAASEVHRALISQIERGRIVATAKEADQLGRALGLSPGSLRTYTVLATEETT
jgi:transcriptional regulator with XRE-family HTH domain